MIYLSPQANVLQDADPTRWGLIATPTRGRGYMPSGYRWLADNGCFSGQWQPDVWLAWLDQHTAYRGRCLMATAPDVVGDAVATLVLYAEYAPMLRKRGWPVGFVAQDGQESQPWPQYDALFIGGTTAWKLSEAADHCIRQAQAARKWVHVGRVNSIKRIRHFRLVGVDSVDGTTLCFHPTNGKRVLMAGLAQPALFTQV